MHLTTNKKCIIFVYCTYMNVFEIIQTQDALKTCQNKNNKYLLWVEMWDLSNVKWGFTISLSRFLFIKF